MTKQKAFGLDIGTHTIKAVWLGKDSKGFYLQAAVRGIAPSRGILSESPIDLEQLSQAIRMVMDEGKITTRSVNLALPENQVYTKVIETPNLSEKELASAIYWEAEQYIPVPLTSVSIDYKIISAPQSKEPSTKMQVLLVGAATSLIEKYEKVLNDAGLSINAIETELISLTRALVSSKDFPATLLVDIGAVSTALAIVRNGVFVFAYSLPSGGLSLSRAIAADLGFVLSQAEEYKKVYGLADRALGGKIGKVTEPILSSIVTEIKKALAFYSEKYSQDPIKQIILSGGSAKLPGLPTYLTERIGIETAIANPWKFLAPQEVPKDIIENAPEYAVAAGLAMRE